MFAFTSVAVNFLFCDELMFEALLWNSIPVLIMSYFPHSSHRYTLIKGLDVQGIKMCSCGCIIIQPCGFQITPYSLDVWHSHHWAATFHKSNQTSFFFSLKSLVATDDDMMNNNHWDRVHFDYSDFNYSVIKTTTFQRLTEHLLECYTEIQFWSTSSFCYFIHVPPLQLSYLNL